MTLSSMVGGARERGPPKMSTQGGAKLLKTEAVEFKNKKEKASALQYVTSAELTELEVVQKLGTFRCSFDGVDKAAKRDCVRPTQVFFAPNNYAANLFKSTVRMFSEAAIPNCKMSSRCEISLEKFCLCMHLFSTQLWCNKPCHHSSLRNCSRCKDYLNLLGSLQTHLQKTKCAKASI